MHRYWEGLAIHILTGIKCKGSYECEMLDKS